MAPSDFPQILHLTKSAKSWKYTFGKFTTDFLACPITGYKVELAPGIKQLDCASPPDTSVGCRQVIVDRTKVKEFEPISLTAFAEGGSKLISNQVVTTVGCPDIVSSYFENVKLDYSAEFSLISAAASYSDFFVLDIGKPIKVEAELEIE
jgi:hypothetical protein